MAFYFPSTSVRDFAKTDSPPPTRSEQPIGGYFTSLRDFAKEASIIQKTGDLSSGFANFLGQSEVGAVRESSGIRYNTPTGTGSFTLKVNNIPDAPGFGDNSGNTTTGKDNNGTGSTLHKGTWDTITDWFSTLWEAGNTAPEDIKDKYFPDRSIITDTFPKGSRNEPIIIDTGEGGVSTGKAIAGLGGALTIGVIGYVVWYQWKRNK